MLYSKSGELRICVDYYELCKQTTNDTFPLPIPDEVLNQLAGATVQCEYWQVPINPKD